MFVGTTGLGDSIIQRKYYILSTFAILCTGLITCMITMLVSPLFLVHMITSYFSFKCVWLGPVMFGALIFAGESKQHKLLVSNQGTSTQLIIQAIEYYLICFLFGMMFSGLYTYLDNDGWIVLVIFGISLIVTIVCTLIGLILPRQRIRYAAVVVWMLVLGTACLFVSFVLKLSQIEYLLLEGLIVLCCVGTAIQVNQLKFDDIKQELWQCWSDVFWTSELLFLNFVTLVMGIIALIFSSSDDNN